MSNVPICFISEALCIIFDRDKDFRVAENTDSKRPGSCQRVVVNINSKRSQSSSEWLVFSENQSKNILDKLTKLSKAGLSMESSIADFFSFHLDLRF